ncbi:MAG: tRNA (adenine-N1)-methyltransferase [Chloroflexi bacterium]|nr:tRNA (adenine-N1)-methyltransferase [Chloroflexota bacterium]
MTLSQAPTVAYGDTVIIVSKDRKIFIRTVRPARKLQTHYGEVDFDLLVGIRYGEQFRTHLGHTMFVLRPNLDDILQNIDRATQIIYPKDLGYIALKLGLREGMRVVEAGSGSGALTCLMALLVGETGHVYSYDRRAKMLQQARDNVNRLDVAHRVSFIEQDIGLGFNQTGVDALFLDVPNPEDYLEHAWQALAGGGFLGAIVPTVNQVITLLERLYHGAWFMLQVEELIQRPWKTIPARVRPDDDMIGHTGLLVFARAVYREVRYFPSAHDVATDERPHVE